MAAARHNGMSLPRPAARTRRGQVDTCLGGFSYAKKSPARLTPRSAGDPPADGPDGLVGAIGGNTRIDDERLERPVPHVVGLPPLHLVEQRWIDGPVNHRRGAERVDALVVFGLGVGGAFGQVPVADALELDRRSTSRTGQVDGVGGKVEENFAGNVSCGGCVGASRAAMSLNSSPWARPRRTISIATRRSSSVGPRAAIGSQGRGAVAGPFPHPPFNPCVRFSRTRLTDGLLDMVTQPSGSGWCP